MSFGHTHPMMESLATTFVGTFAVSNPNPRRGEALMTSPPRHALSQCRTRLAQQSSLDFSALVTWLQGAAHNLGVIELLCGLG